jgi:hypothetical protein
LFFVLHNLKKEANMLRHIIGCIMIILLSSSFAQESSKAVFQDNLHSPTMKLDLPVSPEQAKPKTGLEARAVPRLLNYQGYLTDTLGIPITDTLNMTFSIFDAPSLGTLLWTESQTNIPVERGVFSVLLGIVTPIPDNVFRTGINRWLELNVAGQIHSPRTRITSAAYAYTATHADTADYALAAPDDNDWVRGSAPPEDTALFTARLLGIARGGASNALRGSAVFYQTNLGALACTTGTAGEWFQTIAGGYSNRATNQNCLVVAGWENKNDGWDAAICGGWLNSITGYSAFIGGGNRNLVSGYAGTVAGGRYDTVTADYGTVPGGYSNKAAGLYSFAAGQRAKANHAGTFVWADQTAADFASTAVNQFLIRAGGGVGIGTASPAAPLDVNGTARMTGFIMPTGAASGRILTSNASGVGTWQAPLTWIGGSGTANYIPRFTAAITIGNSVIYQSSSYIGIGTTSPGTDRLRVAATSGTAVRGTIATNVWSLWGEGGTTGAGVIGIVNRTAAYGTRGSSTLGVGVYGWNNNTGYYAMRAYNVAGSTRPGLRVDGTSYFAGAKTGFVADICQNDGAGSLEPGDVVIISGSGPAILGEIPVIKVRKADKAEMTGVVGVVDSRQVYNPDGAKVDDDPTATQAIPAVLRYEEGAARANDYLLVVTLGSYKQIKVDASFGAIEPGDILVSSSTPGYAMKSDSPKPGTIIGKALGSLASGAGTIPVIITLQ